MKTRAKHVYICNIIVGLTRAGSVSKTARCSEAELIRSPTGNQNSEINAINTPMSRISIYVICVPRHI